MKKAVILALIGLAGGSASAAILNANPTANNGGAANWATFSDFKSLNGQALSITSMTTASTAAAGGAFNVEVFVFNGSGLGGPTASGPGSSSAGWTSLGIAAATQGATSSGVSLDIDIPDISIPANGSTVGVAFLFTVSGPRYFGSGSGALQNFNDGVLDLVSGNSRSVPFTTTGSFFSSRAHVGSFTYDVIPAPASLALLGLGGLIGGRRRR